MKSCLNLDRPRLSGGIDFVGRKRRRVQVDWGRICATVLLRLTQTGAAIFKNSLEVSCHNIGASGVRADLSYCYTSKVRGQGQRRMNPASSVLLDTKKESKCAAAQYGPVLPENGSAPWQTRRKPHGQYDSELNRSELRVVHEAPSRLDRQLLGRSPSSCFQRHQLSIYIMSLIARLLYTALASARCLCREQLPFYPSTAHSYWRSVRAPGMGTARSYATAVLLTCAAGRARAARNSFQGRNSARRKTSET